MKNTKMEPFQIIGIAVRTTNENDQSAKDIGELWNKFMTKGILDKIPNKTDNAVYSVYTDYESDHTKPYTILLGCRVNTLDTVPKGMVAKTVGGGNYVKFISKGDLTKGIVYAEWLKIWEMDLSRTFTTDFEVYGEKTQNPTDAEVEIFIATK
jgi:predicted transcriptional regulator YdeE